MPSPVKNITYLKLLFILACSSKEDEVKDFENPTLEGANPIAIGYNGTYAQYMHLTQNGALVDKNYGFEL